MHAVQQVRFLGRGRAPRRPLHPTPQRGEREDIRLPLVLVRHPRHPHLHHTPLPHRDYILPTDASLHDADEVQIGPTRQRGYHRPTKQDGGLVFALHTRRELGFGDIPRYNARICKQTEPQLPASHPRRAGRVTTSTRLGIPHLTNIAAA